MKDSLTIVVVGDRAVGKTSLLTTAAEGTFKETVPALKKSPFRLKLDDLDEDCTVNIIDTSLQCQEESEIASIVHDKADVVCIVCAANDVDAMLRLDSYWVPFMTDALHGLTHPPQLIPPRVQHGQHTHQRSNLASPGLAPQYVPSYFHSGDGALPAGSFSEGDADFIPPYPELDAHTSQPPPPPLPGEADATNMSSNSSSAASLTQFAQQHRQQTAMPFGRGPLTTHATRPRSSSTSSHSSSASSSIHSHSGSMVPIVVLITKMDLVAGCDELHEENMKKYVLPLMQHYSSLVLCADCTAKDKESVGTALAIFCRLVLYPVLPIYNARTRTLRARAVRALTRIFTICDEDKDDVLSDDELVQFQHVIFDKALTPKELQGIKNVIGKSTADGIRDGGMTLEGFLFLHKRSIERGQIASTWTVLRAFGYADDLALVESYVHPRVSMRSDATPVISGAGFEFLTRLFNQYDSDDSGSLNAAQLGRLFSICGGIPWEEDVFPFSEERDWDLKQYLSLWSYYCWNHPHGYLEAMVKLGFSFKDQWRASVTKTEHLRATDAIDVSHDHSSERSLGVNSRRFHVAFLFGKQGCGKTTLVEEVASFGSQVVLGYKEELQKTGVGAIDIAQVQHYLLMREFPVNSVDEEILESDFCSNRSDLVLMCYDTTDASSFEYVLKLQEKIKHKPVHVVFVACKCDGVPVVQRAPHQPEEYCELHGIPLLKVSANDDDARAFFHDLVQLSQKPPLPMTLAKQAQQSSPLIYAAIATAAIGLGLYFAYRAYKKSTV